MASPSGFGAMSPFMDRIRQLRDMGSKAVDVMSHPGQMIHDTIMPAPQQDHQQAIEQMNRGLNAHNNDAANASFQPSLSTMKKPLGR